MKIIGLAFFLSFLVSFYSTFASNQDVNFELEEEGFVQDIPFKTSAIVYSLMHESDTNEPNSEGDESAKEKTEQQAIFLSAGIEFNLEDEEYVDDIPFDTKEVLNTMVNFNAGDKNILVQEFYLADEQYIDDIPFDTQQLIAERLLYPEFARKAGLEGTVSVCCKYDENGYLIVLACNCSDQSLRDYVVSVLEDIRLRSGIISLDKEYVLKFNFRSI